MLSAKDLIINYKNSAQIGPVTLSIAPNHYLLIIGPNGSGKSSIMRNLAGLNTPRSGQITLENIPLSNIPIRTLAQKITWTGTALIPHFKFSVLDILQMGQYPHTPNSKIRTPEDALQKFALAPLKNKDFDTLSSGEQQRVYLAKSWVQSPTYWLLDEPHEHLDLNHRIRFNKLLQEELTTSGIILISHHWESLLSEATHLLFLKNGQVVRQGPKETLDIEAAVIETFDLF